MKYLLMIYRDENLNEEPGTPEADSLMQAYYAFTEDINRQGVNLGGAALQGIDTATTVRVRDGETVITDGPFAETKEQLGGYYLVEAPNLDEAIAIAARIPNAKDGSIEIRPLWEFDDMP